MRKKLYGSRVCALVFVLLVCADLVGFSYTWDSEKDAREMETKLLYLPIVSIKGLKSHFLERKKNREATWSRNVMKFVVLEGGLEAVFKKGKYAYAEVAGYKASQIMGLGLVPPAVLRTINGEVGSLQLFIPSIGTIEHYKHELSSKMISDMRIFYFIWGQWDTHPGNQLVYRRNGKVQLALIDNAGMLHRQHIRYGDHAFVGKGKNTQQESALPSSEFPFSEARRLGSGSYHQFSALLIPFITKDHMLRIWNSKNRGAPYLIWRNSLWMQIYKASDHKPIFTSVYYASTLKVAHNLTYDVVRSVWQESYEMSPSHYEDLCRLTLERRDQLVQAALSKGIIKEQ
ncbi:hypothetical protein H0W26_04910 [Candidatus Dependentiae bacterium]|nr:hypothetical protein [Candidatus Dependentiae bacterium]